VKYSVQQNIPIFGTEVLNDMVKGEDGKMTKVPTTLGKFLTLVCVNAQVKNMDEKYRLYKIASRIHDAETKEGELELSPEDIVMLKKLLGEGPYSPVAAGATVDLLEAK
jgi:hypothetical protein